MFDIDKIVNEHNKEMIYGKKPKIPEKLSNVYTKQITEDDYIKEKFSQAEIQIIKKLNQIIDYLEWQEK